MNASVNIYMFEGGSNFGFNNGKNIFLWIYKAYKKSWPFQIQISIAHSMILNDL
jgi:hypothetical protein